VIDDARAQEIGLGDHADEVAISIDDRHATDVVRVQQPGRLAEWCIHPDVDAGLRHDVPHDAFGHHVTS